MNKDIRVVPWDNAAQFKKVYEYLYSNELKKKRWAVDQISVWETKCHPSLPVAIEASLVISRAIIQDILMINDSSLCQQNDIQMMYAMALVRFVNLTIEPHQKMLHASGAQIAKGLGIPSWIIDLRNEATHSFSPALPTLRMAADCAMKYLSESYWEKEVSSLKSKEIRDLDDGEVRNLVHRYIKLQFHILNELERYSGTEEHKQDVTELNEIIGKMATLMDKSKQMFIDVLISGGYFIPFDDELKKIMTEDEYSDYQEFADDICNEARPTFVPPVPVELELLWKKMLNLMHSVGILPRFLEALLKSQAERSEMGKKLVVAWVMRILRILSLGGGIEETLLRKIFTKRFTLINWKTMFHAAVSHPCIYTPCVFPLIFSNLNLNKQFTQYILDLMAISLGQADWKSHKLPRDYSIQTLDTLKHMMRLQNAQKARRNRSSEECLFSYAEDTDYKSWPIGMIVNPVDDDEEENDEGIDDCRPIMEFDEKMDYTEKYFLSNENDIDENCFEVEKDPDLSEEEIDLSDDRQSFLFRMK